MCAANDFHYPLNFREAVSRDLHPDPHSLSARRTALVTVLNLAPPFSAPYEPGEARRRVLSRLRVAYRVPYGLGVTKPPLCRFMRLRDTLREKAGWSRKVEALRPCAIVVTVIDYYRPRALKDR